MGHQVKKKILITGINDMKYWLIKLITNNQLDKKILLEFFMDFMQSGV